MLVRCTGSPLTAGLGYPPDSLVADRFTRHRGAGWIDLATGAAVSLAVRPLRGLKAARSEMCSALVGLWHPHVLSPIDYGLIGRDWRFEAWPASRPHLAVGGPVSAVAVRAALSFLRTHGLVAGETADLPVRELDGRLVLVPRSLAQAVDRLPSSAAKVPCATLAGARGRRSCLPIVGMKLLERATTRWVTDVLDQAACGETRAICVRVQPGGGASTWVLQVAREARERGYVPVAAELAADRPAVQGVLGGRHVLVIDRRDRIVSGEPQTGRRAAADLVLSLRRHRDTRGIVLLSLVPDSAHPAGHAGDESCGAALGPLPVALLAAAATLYPAGALSPAELLDAAHRASGLPGRFVARLRGDPEARATRTPAVAWLVRESAASYTAGPATAPDIRVLRARVSRGAELTGVGRHAAAERLLRATTAAFERRGCQGEAAATRLELIRALVQRGRLGEAEAALDTLDRSAAADVRAGAAVAAARIRTDQARLAEAEQAARAARLAASQYNRADTKYEAVLALARCMFWQGRFDEAAGVLRSGEATTPTQAMRGQLRCARIELARGNLPAAGTAAAAALGSEAGSTDPQLLACAHAAYGLVLAAIGDAGGFRRAMRAADDAARRAHSPLLSLRVRLADAEGLARLHLARDAGLRAAGLRRWLNRPLPPLLRGRVLAALAESGDAKAADEVRRVVSASGARGLLAQRQEDRAMDGLQELHDVLHICHEAQDEVAALEGVCNVLRERLRAIAVAAVCDAERPLAIAGPRASRPSELGARAMEAGLVIGPALSAGGIEAAAPARYGGRPIGAIVARWAIDAQVDAGRVSSILAAAGAACAPSMQAALDRRAAPPVPTATGTPALIGSSPGMEAVREAVRRAAAAPFAVLIEGESGSGKELVARMIHELSQRRRSRLCAINCAALTDDLLEAELFGHARGAFTGAVVERPGMFEEVDGGTLLLDEVSELSPRAQAKLLRAIQDGEIRRVGENVPRRVDVRLISASNRPLGDEVAAGRFRADLRYRLDVVRLVVPPLRERPEDIPGLAAHFWEQAVRRTGSRATLDPVTLAALARYDWPGNVRELQNVMAALAVHAGPRGRVGPRALPECIASVPDRSGPTRLDEARVSFERRFVRAALAHAGGHRGRAARVLGISRQGLTKLLRRLDIDSAGAPTDSLGAAR